MIIRMAELRGMDVYEADAEARRFEYGLIVPVSAFVSLRRRFISSVRRLRSASAVCRYPTAQ